MVRELAIIVEFFTLKRPNVRVKIWSMKETHLAFLFVFPIAPCALELSTLRALPKFVTLRGSLDFVPARYLGTRKQSQSEFKQILARESIF